MAGDGIELQGIDYTVALVWRTDAGPDTTLYGATVPGTAYDPDAGYALFSFTANLAAVPARCGDVFMLTVQQLPGTADGGEVFEAEPTVVIP
jgi:hypothetical protein